ncbi:MAG TPA: S53 family peptidase [Rhizomicrobium sp.]|nr:S53 family peptidase [Rhizomicrobium sp.]
MITSKWRLLAGAATASLCLAASQPSYAVGGWENTHTQAIPLIKAKLLGAVSPTTTMNIAVALQMQNAQALRNLIQSQATPGSADFGKFITPAQFNTSYAPSTAAVNAVTGYLAGFGFSNISVQPNRLFITATGSAAQIQAAFNTTLARFKQNGKQVFVNTTPVQVPQALNGVVLSVLGLNNVAATTPITPCDVSIKGCLRFTYDPQTYWRAYDVGHVTKASKTSVAIMAEGDVSGVIPDLRTFEAAMGLSQVPVSVVQVGLPSSDTSGADEWDLDTQYTTGMAGTVKKLYIYTTTSLTDQDTALEFNKWATDDLAQVGNASFGICEFFPFLDGTMVAADQSFLEAAAQGQTMFSSTGDTGSFCPVGTPNGVPVGAPFVGYPAASPYVIGVGGTTLVTNTNGGYNSEVAWYAGGGGISQFEYSPAWQSPVVPTNSGLPVTFRAIPDISMDADPNTGAIVYVNGATEYIGGTSLSSPLAAGAWARLQSSYNNTQGFAAPRLYAGYPAFGTAPGNPTGLTQKVDGFNDVLTGADGLYTALPYFDFTTGLGTLDISQKQPLLPH